MKLLGKDRLVISDNELTNYSNIISIEAKEGLTLIYILRDRIDVYTDRRRIESTSRNPKTISIKYAE